MKNLLLILLLLVSLISSAQKTSSNSAVSQKLSTLDDSVQYVLGAHIGQYLLSNGFTLNNSTLFKKGMDDVTLGRPMLVNLDSVAPLVKKYQDLSAEIRGQRLEKALFESIKGQAGIGVLPSGVCYSIIKMGTGKRPQLKDSVDLHLKGYYADGKLYEDTYPQNTPYHTTPDGVIPGIKEILQIMPVGSIWKVYIPASFAFGAKGVPNLIPPYSALIYELELLSVQEVPQSK